jgi:hypothetical protein
MWKRVRTNFSPDGSKGRLPLLYRRLNITQFVAVRVRLSSPLTTHIIRHSEGVHDMARTQDSAATLASYIRGLPPCLARRNPSRRGGIFGEVSEL